MRQAQWPRRPPPSKGGRAESKQAIPPLAAEVVQSLLASATGPINPSLIKETMVRKEPDFDEHDHGFSTFSKLLAAMEKEGLLRRQQHGRQWYVVGPEQGESSHGGPGGPGPPADHDPEPGGVEDDEEMIPDPELADETIPV